MAPSTTGGKRQRTLFGAAVFNRVFVLCTAFSAFLTPTNGVDSHQVPWHGCCADPRVVASWEKPQYAVPKAANKANSTPKLPGVGTLNVQGGLAQGSVKWSKVIGHCTKQRLCFLAVQETRLGAASAALLRSNLASRGWDAVVGEPPQSLGPQKTLGTGLALLYKQAPGRKVSVVEDVGWGLLVQVTEPWDKGLRTWHIAVIHLGPQLQAEVHQDRLSHISGWEADAVLGDFNACGTTNGVDWTGAHWTSQRQRESAQSQRYAREQTVLGATHVEKVVPGPTHSGNVARRLDHMWFSNAGLWSGEHVQDFLGAGVVWTGCSDHALVHTKPLSPPPQIWKRIPVTAWKDPTWCHFAQEKWSNLYSELGAVAVEQFPHDLWELYKVYRTHHTHHNPPPHAQMSGATNTQ